MTSSDEESEKPREKVELSTLYPEPKTFEEREIMNQARQARRQDGRPKLVGLKIGLMGGLLMQGGLLLSLNLGALWFQGEIAGVVISYGIGLILLGLAVALIRYALKVAYAYGVEAKILLGFCGVGYFLVYVAILKGALGSYWGVTFVGAIVYALLVGVGARMLIRAILKR